MKKRRTKGKKYTIFTDVKKNKISYLLLVPAFLYTLIFGYLTLPWMLIAFQKYNFKAGLFGSEWVGLKNFFFFFKSDYFITVTVNTLKLNALFIISVTIMALLLAILINELKSRLYVKIVQTTYLLPHFLSWIIASYFIYSFFSFDYGLINKFLGFLGMQPMRWYSNPKPWTWLLVFLRVWKGTGISMIIYLAAIAGIDESIYEAAVIDGANRWQQIRFITLPLLMPTILMLTLLSIGRIFYGDFAMIYSIVRDNGMLFATTDVIDTYVFRVLRRIGLPSQAMAAGFYQSLLGFLFVYGSNRLTKKFFSEGALF